MKMLNQFIRSFQKKPETASLAKERLQIIVSHERLRRNSPNYLPILQKELLEVIVEVLAKYIPVERDQVKVDIERTENTATLALNIMLTDIELAK